MWILGLKGLIKLALKKIILLNLLLVVIFIVEWKGLFCKVRGIVFLPLQLYMYDGLASHPGGGRGGLGDGNIPRSFMLLK